MFVYTGIGSRETPLAIKNLMTEIAMHMASYDWILRSGGANGADLAFETGAGEKKEIYLPSKGFNNSTSNLISLIGTCDDRAELLAEKVWNARSKQGDVHCVWSGLKTFTKLLMTRNIYQVCGNDLKSISNVVICWTSDGKASGGTGQALYTVELMRLDQESKPKEERKKVSQIVNLFHPESVEFIKDMLRSNTNPNQIWP